MTDEPVVIATMMGFIGCGFWHAWSNTSKISLQFSIFKKFILGDAEIFYRFFSCFFVLPFFG